MDKILVVDDTMLVLNAIMDILGKDYDVFTLQNGERTFKLAKELKPSIILLDIVMPNISGYDIIKLLKQDVETQDIPVVFLTSLTGDSDEEKGLELGASDYIGKPFKPGVVKARIKTLIQLIHNREQLKQEREYAKTLAGVSDDVFWIDYDIKTHIANFSANFCELYNVPESLPITLQINDKYHLIPIEYIEKAKQLFDNIMKGNEKFSPEIPLRRYSGELYWHHVQYKIIRDSFGNAKKALCRFTDVTAQKRRIDELSKKAATDQLTLLFNKEETEQRIQKALETRDESEKFALLIVDIDDFKRINDNLGHQFGDAVLSNISRKIRLLFRDSDVVGRIGGDEFAIFMRGITSEENALAKANALAEAFRHTFTGEKRQYKVSGSIGIAFAPLHGTTFIELYRLADIALYESKHSGKDCCTVYHREMMIGTMDNRIPIEEAVRFTASYYADDLIYNIFEMLYETNDMDTTLSMILGIIATKFSVDRCYIIEYSLDRKTLSNTYEWCAQGISSQKGNLQNIPQEIMSELISDYNEDGIFYCNDFSVVNNYLKEIVTKYGVQSMLHSAIYESGVMRGFIGFDECKNKRVWRGEEIATMSYIARVLSTFIFKKQISKDLWDAYQLKTKTSEKNV